MGEAYIFEKRLDVKQVLEQAKNPKKAKEFLKDHKKWGIDSDNNDPLSYAIAFLHDSFIEEHIPLFSNRTGRDGASNTMKMMGVKCGKLIRMIGKRAFNWNLTSEDGGTPLLQAIVLENVEGVKIALEHGANPYIGKILRKNAFEIVNDLITRYATNCLSDVLAMDEMLKKWKKVQIPQEVERTKKVERAVKLLLSQDVLKLSGLGLSKVELLAAHDMYVELIKRKGVGYSRRVFEAMKYLLRNISLSEVEEEGISWHPLVIHILESEKTADYSSEVEDTFWRSLLEEGAPPSRRKISRRMNTSVETLKARAEETLIMSFEEWLETAREDIGSAIRNKLRRSFPKDSEVRKKFDAQFEDVALERCLEDGRFPNFKNIAELFEVGLETVRGIIPKKRLAEMQKKWILNASTDKIVNALKDGSISKLKAMYNKAQKENPEESHIHKDVLNTVKMRVRKIIKDLCKENKGMFPTISEIAEGLYSLCEDESKQTEEKLRKTSDVLKYSLKDLLGKEFFLRAQLEWVRNCSAEDFKLAINEGKFRGIYKIKPKNKREGMILKELIEEKDRRTKEIKRNASREKRNKTPTNQIA